MPYEVIEHTADIGVRATGADIEEALAETVRGFFAIAAPDAEPDTKERWVVEASGDNLEELVVEMLDEVNFVHQIDHVLAAEVELEADLVEGDGGTVRVTLVGERYDEERHGYLMDIKATTYHELRVQVEPALIEVLFDI